MMVELSILNIKSKKRLMKNMAGSLSPRTVAKDVPQPLPLGHGIPVTFCCKVARFYADFTSNNQLHIVSATHRNRIVSHCCSVVVSSYIYDFISWFHTLCSLDLSWNFDYFYLSGWWMMNVVDLKFFGSYPTYKNE